MQELKKIALFVCMVFVVYGAYAQIQVTNSSFPSAGDTLKTRTDITAENLDLGSGGADQMWDFTSLSSPTENQALVLPASEGQNADKFPGADLVVSALGGGVENYISKTENIYADLGFFGGGQGTEFLEVAARYRPANVRLRAPLDYLQTYATETQLLIPAAREDLPDSLLAQLPDEIVFDSIRINVQYVIDGEVDAWGTIEIPGASYEVLRDSRVEYSETRVEVKLGILPWADVSGLLMGVLPGLLGQDTTQMTYFLADDVEEPIAVVQQDIDDNIISVSYKSERGVTSTQAPQGKDSPWFSASPNPAFRTTSILYEGFDPGFYTIRIFDILGSNVYLERKKLESSGEIKIDISGMRRGTYFYSILDENGKPFRTKRLMIIRP